MLQKLLFIALLLPAVAQGKCKELESDAVATAAKQLTIDGWIASQPKGPKLELRETFGCDLTDCAWVRRTHQGRCTDQFWNIDLTLREPACKYMIGDTKLVAENCCEGTPCPDRSPAGWMLELFRRSEKKNTAGLVELISPNGTFKAKDPGDSKSTTVTRKSPNAAEVLNSGWEPVVEALQCPETFVAGKATCRVGRSGGYTQYDWVLVNGKAYLSSRIYTDTGE